MLAKADTQFPRAISTLAHPKKVNGLREQNNSTTVSAEKFSHEGWSKCNYKEYTILEVSAGRNIKYLTKTRPSNFKIKKIIKKNFHWKLPPTRDDKLWKNITCTSPQDSKRHRIKRPRHTDLLNSSQKTSRYATRRQINSADGSIVEAETATKIKKCFK